MSYIPRSSTTRISSALVLVAFVVAACGSSTQQAPTVPASAPSASSLAQSPGVPGASPSSPDQTPGIPSPDLPPVEHTPLPAGPSFKLKAFASRVVVADLGIDLPIISGDLQPPPSYPYCDVAAYVTRFVQPYEPGLTYISAHAQKGMFLPLLRASEVDDGASLIGQTIQVYVSDGRLFGYTVTQVVRHAIDYSVLETIPLDEQTLILQTSEGVYGTVEKLQVVATLSSQETVDLATANPVPHPRDCEPTPTESPATASATP